MRVLQVVTAVAVLTMVANMPEARAGEGFTSFGPKEAERTYESAVKQARQTYLAALRRALSSMPATQIDEANRVNAVIKRLEAEIAGRAGEPSTESQAADDPKKMLIGKWGVRSNSGQYQSVWAFKENGTVTSTEGAPGKWELQADRALITWSDGHWDALVFPLDRKSTVMDGQNSGPKAGTATKK